MKRFYHVRAPLMIAQFIGFKEVMPAVIPELASAKGGCTILIEDHDDEYVMVKVAWCRWTDYYSRKLGRALLQGGKISVKNEDTSIKNKFGSTVRMVDVNYPGKEGTLVLRSELEAELEAIEEQMLISCAWPTRHDSQLMKDCIGKWSQAASRFFNKTEEKVAVSS